jgi:hypothetical protein
MIPGNILAGSSKNFARIGAHLRPQCNTPCVTLLAYSQVSKSVDAYQTFDLADIYPLMRRYAGVQ